MILLGNIPNIEALDKEVGQLLEQLEADGVWKIL